MSDDQNPQGLNQNNVAPVSGNVVSVGKEGESITLKPKESTGSNLKSEREEEIASKVENQIEKIETSPNKSGPVFNQNPILNSNLSNSSQAQIVGNKTLKNLPISLDEAVKMVKSFFIFQDSSDPLLWLSFLVIKNFQLIDKNKK